MLRRGYGYMLWVGAAVTQPEGERRFIYTLPNLPKLPVEAHGFSRGECQNIYYALAMWLDDEHGLAPYCPDAMIEITTVLISYVEKSSI